MNVKHQTVLWTVLVLTGCAKEPDIAHRTVEEYRADDALRSTVLKRCRNDPGTLGETPDCINAREAQRLESRGSLRESGGIGLDPQKKH